MTLLMVFLPLALIWVVVITLRSVRELRAEAARLQATVDAMRASLCRSAGAGGSGMKPSVETQAGRDCGRRPRQAETVLATFTSRRDAALTRALGRPQGRAGCRRSPSPRPNSRPWRLAPRPRICARRCRWRISSARCSFPKAPEDKEGFRALRLALEDRDRRQADPRGAGCADAAEPGRHLHGRPEARPCAARAVAALCRRASAGGRLRRWAASATGPRLALTAGRMRDDPVFRDAAPPFPAHLRQDLCGLRAERHAMPNWPIWPTPARRGPSCCSVG